MHLSFDSFCEIVKNANKTNAESALAVLWYFDHEQPGVTKTAGQLAKILDDHHIGTPNQTALAEALRRSKLASEWKSGFSLKPGSRKLIRDWLPDLDGVQPVINHAFSYLPEPIWKSTRGYIEAVCRELNGSFHHGYYNAAAVMLRRLLETLIIEAYEHLDRGIEIKDGAGNYLMLSELAERVCGENGHNGINLGRDSKKALKEARSLGNWSAHARRFLAYAGDLTKLQTGMRLLVQELVQIANLAKKT
ncbi:DUF4145 domain-containing protein [Bradyrhizobium sp. CB82]|uniref:DUF4145 domain-containing protein n=1 Tax=Bradyrhizobium sp. CB82 TaxID=3039159 RepID=UPI0024B26376|nr:DUF4145 domain-containing protein [Bradyrhizobium sp. CB82]WFU40064.1 DUF4145 domain-containing protein [Bradyrhizobium sp. CB82]